MAEFDLNGLPDLVLEKIFKYLSVRDRGHLACVNRRMAGLMHTPDVWREVSLDLVTDFVHCYSKGCLIFVDRIRDCDWIMLEKYGQYFWRVSVIMRSGLIGNQTLAVLTELAERRVIQSVNLGLDGLLSSVMNWKTENSSVPRPLGCATFGNRNLISSPEPERAIRHLTASHIIDSLIPDTDFTITLPTQSHNIRDIFEKGYHCIVDNKTYEMVLYLNQKSENWCSRVKKLILSSLPVPEKVISSHFQLGPMMSPPPTAQQMFNFPKLQELHVNIVNLSDQLLQELSGVRGSREPLRRLVIRHIVCDCEVKGMPESYLESFFLCWYKSTFPQLSSAAWDQLAQSCPSLTVECSVVSARLPQLLDVIKPDTPLVRLEVLCHTTCSDDQSVPVLKELRENHSRLTVVDMPYRAYACTNADLRYGTPLYKNF